MHRHLSWIVFAVITLLSIVELGWRVGVPLGLWLLLSGVAMGYVTALWQERYAGWMGAPFGWFMWLFLWPLMLLYCVWHNERRKQLRDAAVVTQDPALLLRHSPDVHQPTARGFRHPQVLSLDYLDAARSAGQKRSP